MQRTIKSLAEGGNHVEAVTDLGAARYEVCSVVIAECGLKTIGEHRCG
jgi:hypothetical protein